MLIPPEQVLEKSIEYFEQYGPKLEELFDVDLSGLAIKTHLEMADDLQAIFERTDASCPKTPMEEVLAESAAELGGLDALFFQKAALMIRNRASAHYLIDIDTVYIDVNPNQLFGRPETEGEFKRKLVHELGHAIVARLVPLESIPVSHELWRYVDEGFAEYMSTVTFQPLYGSLDAMLACNAMTSMHEVVVSIHRIAEQYGRQQDIPTGVTKDDWDMFIPHCWGYFFFRDVTAASISPVDVLFNPPQEFSEIINPGEYVLRIRTEGKSL